MLDEIRLITDGYQFDKPDVKLQLYKGVHLFKYEDILSSTKVVYEDIPYELEVDDDLSDYAYVSLFFNNEEIQVVCKKNKIIVTDEGSGKTIFNSYFGFLQIRLLMMNIDGTEENYYSEYASIMVKKGTKKSRNVEGMLKYIYDNQKSMLYNSANLLDIGNNYDETFSDFASELTFLGELADTYERNAGYFKANSRFKLEQVEKVDTTNKIQYLNDKTIRYIVEHPNNLHVDKTGIKVGAQSFLPDKTLMIQNRITTDIYENRVIVSFIKKILYDTKKLRDSIVEYISLSSSNNIQYEGYVSSSNLIFSNVVDALKEYKDKTDVLYNRFVGISAMYSKILPVDEIDCSVLPRPTQLFLSVPQYNQMYTVIYKWYQKSGYDFKTEKVMLRLIDIPSIYELYILVRLIEKVSSKGYESVASKRINYPGISKLFELKETNNTLVFRKDNKELTIYYEPVIYNNDSSYNDISLFRNTSVPYSRLSINSRSHDFISRGSYYVPDYIIKIKENEQEKYVIIDAKYARFDKVKYLFAPELVYKYLFSISPLNDKAEIIGLGIINGIYNGEAFQSMYDGGVSCQIKPFVNFVPLSEEVENEVIDSNLERFWKNMLI